jgi:hypothetical protein
MITNATYSVAMHLQTAGQWEAAAALVDGDPAYRAQILVERSFFTGKGTEEAVAAVDALDPGTARDYLLGQLAYQRLLFEQAEAGDEDVVRQGLDAADQEPALQGWSKFRRGVFAENVLEDLAGARTSYEAAYEHARAAGDLYLESYVVRHLGGLAADAGDPQTAETLLRRSLHLRAALGARPQVAAAQATLADFIADGPEKETLREAARHAGRELGISWL